MFLSGWKIISPQCLQSVQSVLNKYFFLCCSTSEFRSAFLKTIRQIIRESVRNMSLPALDNLRKPDPPLRSESTKLSSAGGQSGSPQGQTAHTLQLNRKKQPGAKQNYSSLQRHSSGGNIDYDNVENCRMDNMRAGATNGRSRTLGDGLDELADIALHSESDSVRDECSSGVRSEPEEEERQERRRKPQLGSTPAHLSLSTNSSLSSASTTSQARLVQSSAASGGGHGGHGGGHGGGPPAPPPRTSSAGIEHGQGNSAGSGRSELGKHQAGGGGEAVGSGGGGGSKTTCMQCYLSGHSDGSLDSVEPSISTEGSSSAEPGPVSVPAPGLCRDRDSGIMEDKFDRFDSGSGPGSSLDQEDRINH